MVEWWNPGAFARKLPKLRARGRMMAALRAHFIAEGFDEVETPALQVSPGLEPNLAAFATRLEGPDGASRELFLHTSPEFAMKKLLVAGAERIFQFAKVYRNGERAATHHPEFTMLEWYRAGAETSALKADCHALLRTALTAVGAASFRWAGRESDPSAPWQEITVAEAFVRYAGIDLAPETACLRREAERIGLRTDPGDDWDDLFFRVFLEKIEPHLGSPAPTLLTDYPLRMAALSRPKPGAPGLADRFELYVCGLELANAFGELTDGAVQRARFEADREARRRRLGSCYPIDEDFLAALAFGMPESAGIALGLDRLAMLATGAARIEDVLWAPVAVV